MSKKLRCPSCKAIIDADESQKTVHCDGCGKNYKNPYYKEIEIVENGSEEQESVVAPTNADTDEETNDNVNDNTVQSEAIVPSVFTEEKTDGIDEEKLAKVKKKRKKSITAVIVLAILLLLNSISSVVMQGYVIYLTDYVSFVCEIICFITAIILCKNREDLSDTIKTCLIILIVFSSLGLVSNIISICIGIYTVFPALLLLVILILSAVNLKNIKPFIPKYVVPAHLDGHSEFTAGLFSLIWLNFVNILIKTFTLGLCTPWAVRREYTWLYEHQVIDDRKLVFDGTAASLFGQWVKWSLLSVVTLGIYTLFVPIKKMQWITKNTHIKDVVIDTQENKSKFDGKFWSYWGMRLVNGLIIVFSLGFCTPWAIVREQRWFTEHQIFDGQRLAFDGSAMGLFGQWIKWMLLSIITLGIYAWWIPIKKQKWITEHTHFSINA